MIRFIRDDNGPRTALDVVRVSKGTVIKKVPVKGGERGRGRVLIEDPCSILLDLSPEVAATVRALLSSPPLCCTPRLRPPPFPAQRHLFRYCHSTVAFFSRAKAPSLVSCIKFPSSHAAAAAYPLASPQWRRLHHRFLALSHSVRRHTVNKYRSPFLMCSRVLLG